MRVSRIQFRRNPRLGTHLSGATTLFNRTPSASRFRKFVKASRIPEIPLENHKQLMKKEIPSNMQKLQMCKFANSARSHSGVATTWSMCFVFLAGSYSHVLVSWSLALACGGPLCKGIDFYEVILRTFAILHLIFTIGITVKNKLFSKKCPNALLLVLLWSFSMRGGVDGRRVFWEGIVR